MCISFPMLTYLGCLQWIEHLVDTVCGSLEVGEA